MNLERALRLNRRQRRKRRQKDLQHANIDPIALRQGERRCAAL